MALNVALLGSSSNHGGSIISGTSVTTLANNTSIAMIGSLHNCPREGHGITPIVSSMASISFAEGSLIATVGSICGCGAVIITGSSNVLAG